MELPAEMYVTYLQRRKIDFDRLKEALNAGRLSDFKTIGHQIKGNAASFGFDALTQIGVQLEKLDETSLQSQAPALLDQFRNWIETTEHKLSKSSV